MSALEPSRASGSEHTGHAGCQGRARRVFVRHRTVRGGRPAFANMAAAWRYASNLGV
jgi:hypothetical protein